jgi:hypothetical protein
MTIDIDFDSITVIIEPESVNPKRDCPRIFFIQLDNLFFYYPKESPEILFGIEQGQFIGNCPTAQFL